MKDHILAGPGRKVADGVRAIVIPATQAIYLQAMEEGLLKTFIEVFSGR